MTKPNDKLTDQATPAVVEADRKRDQKEALREGPLTIDGRVVVDFSSAATHVMMWHPRSPESKNFSVLCKRDDGNGSGLFVTEQGETLEVVRAHDDDGKLLAVERRDNRIVRQNVVSVLLR